MSDYDTINQQLYWLRGDIKALAEEVEELKRSVQRKAELTQSLAVRQTLKNQRLEEELDKKVRLIIKVEND